jgi:hypothetical protein
MGQGRAKTAVARAPSLKSTLQANYESPEGLRALKALFQELVSKLPQSCASIHLRSEPKCAVLDLVPANPNAAPISITVPLAEKQGVTLVAGKGSFFEIPPEGHRYTDLPFVEEVRSICIAVIAGTLSESVLLDGDEVLQGEGSIKLSQASAPTTVRWRQFYFRPFRKKDRKHFRYEPYCRGSDGTFSIR